MRSEYDNWDECREDVRQKADSLIDEITDALYFNGADKSITNKIRDKVIDWIKEKIKEYDL